MVIAAVDPDRGDLKLLVRFLRMSFPGCEVTMFTDPEAAAAYIRDNPIDVLYTETTMPGLNGFALQAAAEAVQPAVLTVFVSGTDAYIPRALRSRAQGYVLKPVTREALRESMNETRFEPKPKAI